MLSTGDETVEERLQLGLGVLSLEERKAEERALRAKTDPSEGNARTCGERSSGVGMESADALADPWAICVWV